MKQVSNRQLLQRCLRLLCIGAVLVNIKSIFADFDVDSEYAVVMSYRQLLGDTMFAQMWEPHQTSAFLITFLIWIYRTVIGTTTGVVLFLHFVGVLLWGLLTAALYKVLNKKLDSELLLLICIFFFTVRPKDVVLPEFSNMQMGFSVVVFCCLLQFFSHQDKRIWLVAASLGLCLQILAYPSCLIVYLAVVILLGIYTDKKWSNVLLFSCCCFFMGVGYILLLSRKNGIQALIHNISRMIQADGSHSNIITQGKVSSMPDFIFNWYMAVFVLLALAAGVLWYLIKKGSLKEKLVSVIAIALLVLQTAHAVIYHQEFVYVISYALIIGMGLTGIRYCNEDEKRIYFTGLILSAASYISIDLLTNWNPVAVIVYLILAVAVSFVPVSRWLEHNMSFSQKVFRWGILLLFCLAVILRRGILTRTMNRMAPTIFDLRGIVTAGPAVGIVTDYIGYYETRCDIEDWEKYVMPGDRLLVVDDYLPHGLVYMYQDVVISAHSVISTPTYNETLLDYWEQNPEKVPNVIVVNCWYGNLMINEDNWIFEYLNDGEKVYSSEDGRYWRFYLLD